MRRKTLRRVTVGALVVALLVLGWVYSEAKPFGGHGNSVVVQIMPGETVSQLGATLQRDHVIGSSLLFHLYASVFGSPIGQPGFFQVHQNSSFSEIHSVFTQHPDHLINVSAGLTLREVALNQLATQMGNHFASRFIIDAKDASVASAWRPAHSLEGLIGTGVYLIAPGETPAQLVAAMQERFLRQARAVGLTPHSTIHGLSAYQLLIATSIVEKEGYYPKNMPQVARVILNRLRRGGGLQMDSTILYSLGQDGGSVTHAMLQIDTPYNTYLHAGLTPTPICAVSEIALRAMIHPTPGNWLYFTLISKDGTEAFANTFAEQLRNEQIAASRGL
jgi:UPF0755 protein